MGVIAVYSLNLQKLQVTHLCKYSGGNMSRNLMDDSKGLRDEVLQLRKNLEQANQLYRKKEAEVVMMKMKKPEGSNKGYSGRGCAIVVVVLVVAIVYLLIH
ncbi:uncharacterized protein LOC125499083 isoform X2 [Beta vulgaris subsp. vulgaris]|uniref:uncharacterized protein LOC125499083 isoform X2 n=1 Tax=Beta vulgaris subsp. vulgaris TaxID=3555 RepID=UPI0025498930|nr:uncharacterized protein LOC125499083 isoform X2 [Beta vulgaris subsp. vulgaris]